MLSDTKFDLTSFQEEKPTFRVFTLGFTDKMYNRPVQVRFTTRHGELDNMEVDVHDKAHGFRLYGLFFDAPFERCSDEIEDRENAERYRKLCLEVINCATTTLFLSEGI